MELRNMEGGTPKIDPREFNGQWFFTNPDTEDFTFSWNGTPYEFRAMSTSPFVILDANALEMQGIRKDAAKKLARRMFGKSTEYKALVKIERDGLKQGRAIPPYYDEDEKLAPYIQQCLNPLPAATVKVGKKKSKEIHTHDSTRVYGEKDVGNVSLVEEALNAKE